MYLLRGNLKIIKTLNSVIDITTI